MSTSTEFLVPGIDPETGKIDPAVLPPWFIASTVTPNSVDWGFAGELTERVGVQMWRGPQNTIVPIRFTVTLGTLMVDPAPSETLRLRLMCNGVQIASADLGHEIRTQQSQTFSLNPLPANGLLSVDIEYVPTAGTLPGDAVCQLWWVPAA